MSLGMGLCNPVFPSNIVLGEKPDSEIHSFNSVIQLC